MHVRRYALRHIDRRRGPIRDVLLAGSSSQCRFSTSFRVSTRGNIRGEPTAAAADFVQFAGLHKLTPTLLHEEGAWG